jgi:hypothetical protein
MTHIADLSPAGLDGSMVHVGWLDRRHRYQRGRVPDQVLPALQRLVQEPPWSSGRGGWHGCNLGVCLVTRAPFMDVFPTAWARTEVGSVRLGSYNYLVPGRRRSYHVPGLIIHYVKKHRYQPPDEFIHALLEQEPGSPEFRAGVAAVGRRVDAVSEAKRREMGT